MENGSNYNPVYHGMILLNPFERLGRDRPVTILGLPGFGPVVTSLGFGYWTVTNYLKAAPSPSGSLVSVSLVIVGTLASITGIPLHGFNTHLDDGI